MILIIGIEVTFENLRFSNVGACTGGHLSLINFIIKKGANNWNWGDI
jgi:hypothetical protein